MTVAAPLQWSRSSCTQEMHVQHGLRREDIDISATSARTIRRQGPYEELQRTITTGLVGKSGLNTKDSRQSQATNVNEKKLATLASILQRRTYKRAVLNTPEASGAQSRSI